MEANTLFAQKSSLTPVYLWGKPDFCAKNEPPWLSYDLELDLDVRPVNLTYYAELLFYSGEEVGGVYIQSDTGTCLAGFGS